MRRRAKGLTWWIPPMCAVAAAAATSPPVADPPSDFTVTEGSDVQDTIYIGTPATVALRMENNGPGTFRIIARYLEDGLEKKHVHTLAAGEKWADKFSQCYEVFVEIVPQSEANPAETASGTFSSSVTD